GRSAPQQRGEQEVPHGRTPERHEVKYAVSGGPRSAGFPRRGVPLEYEGIGHPVPFCLPVISHGCTPLLNSTEPQVLCRNASVRHCSAPRWGTHGAFLITPSPSRIAPRCRICSRSVTTRR